ncbi:TetR/AcrR family transcriptional regulator [Pelagicoccus mobilis]|uniref:TetR/AcrR family transcriptional regulator n=1 Tax=Pelagicoccus mobilis TaxID=415221 RepID=A0A934VSR1_9BACT|nr:TetR/AcrR family transcriptional regulator [Pelagicoccus mobilis]MBK1878764.1 TetR/AcrR family transcriptional regulator [Pelagicoccus mobilis]
MARPAKHDRAAVLEAATSLFWERGYRGVSISDLVKATGMLAGSFYSSFGSKEGIFIECIHHYGGLASEHYKAADRAKSPLKKIENLLRILVADALKHEDRRACFVMNSLLEIAPQHPKVSKILQEYLRLSEAWIEEKLEAAKAAGELAPQTDCAKLASCLWGISYGIRVKARAGESAERVKHYQKAVFSALVDPWRVEAAAV